MDDNTRSLLILLSLIFTAVAIVLVVAGVMIKRELRNED